MEKFESQYRFLDRTRSAFGTDDVVLIHDAGLASETRIIVEAHIQPELGFFELDTPIYEGDLVEVDDSRGGKRTLYVAVVNMYKTSSNLKHTEVKWGPQPATHNSPASPTSQGHHTYNGPVVIINGDQAQVAWNGGSVNRTDNAIAQEFTALAVAVTDALKLVVTGADPDEAQVAEDASKEILEELTKKEPERKKVRAGLATLRGILTTVTTAAATGSAGGAIEELMRRLTLGS